MSGRSEMQILKVICWLCREEERYKFWKLYFDCVGKKIDTNTKSCVLIWLCREEDRCRYYTRKHLTQFVKRRTWPRSTKTDSFNSLFLGLPNLFKIRLQTPIVSFWIQSWFGYRLKPFLTFSNWLQFPRFITSFLATAYVQLRFTSLGELARMDSSRPRTDLSHLLMLIKLIWLE